MFNVNSTGRAKRIARDLQEALAVVGKPLGYSACLEMSARMLGHPSFGMLSRVAGHAVATPDDSEVSAREASARRALHADVLLQAGLPPSTHDAILLKVRPTSRAKAKVAAGHEVYGCAWFDDDATAGWACADGGEPFRFDDPDELDRGTTWWTSLCYDERYRRREYPSNVLSDKHLTLSPKSALQENGLDLSESGCVRAAASLGAAILGRSRKIADASVSASCKSLIHGFGVGWKRHHGVDAMSTPPVSAWEEFVATPLRTHKGRPIEVARQPRLAYARSMMDAEIPVGPYEHVNLEGNPVRAMRLRYVRDHADIAFVHALPVSYLDARCPIRSALWHTRAEPAWVSLPVFELLGEAMDLMPLAVMRAPEMRKAGEFLPDAASDFLRDADASSWTDGIVAEAVWRSGLSNVRMGSGSWQGSLAGLYLRGLDHARMCRESLKMYAEGKIVSCYGLGWVRFSRPSD